MGVSIVLMGYLKLKVKRRRQIPIIRWFVGFGLVIAALFPLTHAETSVLPRDIHFIYIHGTNHNTPQSHQDFNQAVKRLHPILRADLSQDPLVQAHLLKNGAYRIDTNPIAFFWGDQSREEANIVETRAQLFHSMVATRVRMAIAATLHDAVWLENDENKYKVLSRLYSEFISQTTVPRYIVLMGHSAGSMVTFEFVLDRLPYINVADFASRIGVAPDIIAFLKSKNPPVQTCLEALLKSDAVRFDRKGELVPFLKDFQTAATQELTSLRAKHLNELADQINEADREVCLPQGSLKGVVTFGSPIVLFFSTALDPQSVRGYLTSNMLQYILAHDMFWLHVNHVKDPIGIPFGTGENPQQTLEGILKAPVHPRGGFLIGYPVRGKATVISAHSWYWNHPKQFSQAIVKAYNTGYHDWYH